MADQTYEDDFLGGEFLRDLIKEGEQMIEEMLTNARTSKAQPDWDIVNQKVEEARAAVDAIERGGYLDRFEDLTKDELDELIQLLEQLKQAALIDLPMTLLARGNDGGKPSMPKP